MTYVLHIIWKKDAEGFDAYTALHDYNDSGSAFTLKFTSPGGFTREKDFVITSWADDAPIDGLNTANVTFKVSATPATVE